MPCDNRLMHKCNTEYEATLNEVAVLISMYDGHQFILCGDLNTSFERNNAQTQSLNTFLETNYLSLVWNHDRSKKEYTYVNDSLRHASCIDHFIVSLNIYRRIMQNRVLCDPINVSSHHTVLFEF